MSFFRLPYLYLLIKMPNVKPFIFINLYFACLLAGPGRTLSDTLQRHCAQTWPHHIGTWPAVNGRARTFSQRRHARQMSGQHFAGAVEGRQGERGTATAGHN